LFLFPFIHNHLSYNGIILDLSQHGHTKRVKSFALNIFNTLLSTSTAVYPTSSGLCQAVYDLVQLSRIVVSIVVAHISDLIPGFPTDSFSAQYYSDLVEDLDEVAHSVDTILQSIVELYIYDAGEDIHQAIITCACPPPPPPAQSSPSAGRKAKRNAARRAAKTDHSRSGQTPTPYGSSEMDTGSGLTRRSDRIYGQGSYAVSDASASDEDAELWNASHLGRPFQKPDDDSSASDDEDCSSEDHSSDDSSHQQDLRDKLASKLKGMQQDRSGGGAGRSPARRQ
jgi:hypothetical protein